MKSTRIWQEKLIIEKLELHINGKQLWMGSECKSLNWLLLINFNSVMMMTGPLIPWRRKMVVQHFMLEGHY